MAARPRRPPRGGHRRRRPHDQPAALRGGPTSRGGRTPEDVAGATGARTLVELGSGSSEKTRLLLDALRRNGTLQTFVPLDVSASALEEAAAVIAADYPGLAVHGVVGDFTEHLDLLPGTHPRLLAF